MMQTYEVFGLLFGRTVPLAQVVLNLGGQYYQVPGSRILVGDSPRDGFGLAGMPGAWSMLYPGQSPANFGLDANRPVLGHDGTRGWVLSAAFLMQLFGYNWRGQIYGAPAPGMPGHWPSPVYGTPVAAPAAPPVDPTMPVGTAENPAAAPIRRGAR